MQSTIFAVVLVSIFNNEEPVYTEIQDSDQDGTYDIEFDTSSKGSYEFLVAAIDVAGNIYVHSDSGEKFFSFQINEIQPTSSTTPTTASTSTDTQTANYFSGSILLISIIGIFVRKKRKTN